MVTYEQIKKSRKVNTYIAMADATLEAIGFTEHNIAHATRVATVAGNLLRHLDFDERTVELAQIAGHMHDIGNIVNREDHSQSGAILAFRLLDDFGMNPKEISQIVSAIGNHDEMNGMPVNSVAAALILADKADVRRSRVRNTKPQNFDIHDRVNYSVEKSKLRAYKEKNYIELKLTIDTEISSVMDYFQIFLTRMNLCVKAAETLGCRFGLNINDIQMI